MIRFTLAKLAFRSLDRFMDAADFALSKVEVAGTNQHDRAVAEAQRLTNKRLDAAGKRVQDAVERADHYAGYAEELAYLAAVEKDDFAEHAEALADERTRLVGSLYRGK